MEPAIALVFSPEAWVEDLHRHLTDHGGARVRHLVLEPSLALEEEYDTLVVSHRWPALARPLVEGVQHRGRRVLAVYDPDEPSGRDYLASLGVDRVISSDASTAEFVAALVGLTPSAPRPGALPAGLPRVSDDAAAGVLTVVGGPAGAGSTEVAVALACGVAARGEHVVLVDADDASPGVAPRLGLPIEPNLRSAVDAVEYGLGELADTIAVVHRRLHVLCGFPGAAAADDVEAREVIDVLQALRRSHAHVIADVAADAGHGIAAASAAAAAVLVGVGTGNPVGVMRLFGWVAGTRRAAPETPLHLVVNRAPVDRYRRAEIADEVRRVCAPASLRFVPSDRLVEASAWGGEMVTRGAFAAEVTALADSALPRVARRARPPHRARGRREATR